jgi:hypothetical protein
LGMRSEILGMGSGITVEQFTIKPHILIWKCWTFQLM